jgi:CRISPR-associated endoribonuclease Cas6
VLLSLTLFLKPGQDDVLPNALGRAAHACFLSLVSKFDASFASQLHNAPEKPFSVSLLHGPATVHGDAPGSPKEPLYWLRFTSVHKELSLLLWELHPNDIASVSLSHVEFEVNGIAKQEEEHPWAGQSTYEELYNNGLVRAKRGEHLIGLEFASPTSFRLVNSRLNMPLPWPRLVFQSLAEKWNAFSPIPLWLDWPAFDRQVSVARHHLETRMLDFGRYRQVGFVGECWYLIDRSADLRLRQTLHALAEFAFYAGVGRKTTMGMGLVRRIESNRR